MPTERGIRTNYRLWYVLVCFNFGLRKTNQTYPRRHGGLPNRPIARTSPPLRYRVLVCDESGTIHILRLFGLSRHNTIIDSRFRRPMVGGNILEKISVVNCLFHCGFVAVENAPEALTPCQAPLALVLVLLIILAKEALVLGSTEARKLIPKVRGTQKFHTCYIIL